MSPSATLLQHKREITGCQRVLATRDEQQFHRQETCGYNLLPEKSDNTLAMVRQGLFHFHRP